MAQDPSNPYRFAVLLVPRSVVYYEQLQRGLALPNQGSSSGSGQQNTTIGAYGLKVKNAEADTAKSNEKLQGDESKSSNGSSSTSTTTQRGGSSGDTKVKALQVAVKKKSGSQGNSGDQGTEQVELESNDLANAPIKRGEESGQSVQLKAADFGTTPSSSGSGGNSNPGSPTP